MPMSNDLVAEFIGTSSLVLGGCGSAVLAAAFPEVGIGLAGVSQVVGGIAGAFVLYMIASGKAGFDVAGGLASNGYGAHSPGGYTLQAGFLSEIVMTLMFLLIILRATDRRAPAGFAPIADALIAGFVYRWFADER